MVFSGDYEFTIQRLFIGTSFAILFSIRVLHLLNERTGQIQQKERLQIYLVKKNNQTPIKGISVHYIKTQEQCASGEYKHTKNVRTVFVNPKNDQRLF